MWVVERIVHFPPGAFVEDGLSHFGFHDRAGRLFAVDHQGHRLGLVGADGRLAWTAAASPVAADVANVFVPLSFPMFVDVLPDGSPIVSNFGDALLWRIDLHRMRATVLVDGDAIGMVDMGNCVVDADGAIWVNEVRGGRLWRFDADGNVIRTLEGFSWIYDIRLAPSGDLYVLDSRNLRLRAVDRSGAVRTVAGTGEPGYTGDGGDALDATFGSDPSARFDGPISLAVDERGDVYVGDRFNHVVRVIDHGTDVITTIAGTPDADDDRTNDPFEHDPLRLNLPQISSMDYSRGRLFVPTDLDPDGGDLAVLRRV